MFDKLESLIDRLLRKYNMNDCWKSKSEDEIKIYFLKTKSLIEDSYLELN